MAGSVPPTHDAYPLGPATISHSTDGSYNDNANGNPTTSYGAPMTFQNNNQIPHLNQSEYSRLALLLFMLNSRRLVISVLGGPQQSTHGHLLSPSHTISPTIFSPGEQTLILKPLLVRAAEQPLISDTDLHPVPIHFNPSQAQLYTQQPLCCRISTFV
jgi:hypothetical protein